MHDKQTKDEEKKSFTLIEQKTSIKLMNSDLAKLDSHLPIIADKR